jgi:hypothetical protein
MAEKKASKPRQKAILTLEETAEHLGVTPDELMQSRGRGMEPGRSGFKKDGVLVWNRKDLPAKE